MTACTNMVEEDKWGSLLPVEILTLIAKRVHDVVDLVRMGVVCRLWRATSLDHKWHPILRPSPLPWFMLPCPSYYRYFENLRNKKPDADMYCFYNPLTEETFSILLPEARCCRCYGVGGGWLMTSDGMVGSRTPIILHLLHPLSRVQIRLPTLFLTLFSSIGSDFILDIDKAVFTSPPVNDIRQNCLVLIKVSIRGKCRLAYARPGDVAWKVLHPPPSIECYDGYQDMLYREDKFYMTTCDGEVMVYNVVQGRQDVRLEGVISTEFPFRCLHAQVYHYLLFVGGDLAVCGVYNVNDESGHKHRFKLSKLGSCTAFSEWTEVTNTGDGYLYITDDLALFLSPIPQHCRNNSFFTCDAFHQICGDQDIIALYGLDDDTFLPCPVYLPPIWLTFNY